MQLIIAMLGIAMLVLMTFYFSETSHPGSRGVDKLRSQGQTHLTSYVVNPFGPLMFLRSPNLLGVAFVGYTALMTEFALLVPLPYTIGARYNITDELWIGACALPLGIGNMIGGMLAGLISDRIVIKWRDRRGAWYPEDRLRAALPGALMLVPISVLCSGLVTQYVGDTIGLLLNFVCFFINGIGVDIVLSPSAVYNVDVMRSRGAEVVAANTSIRAFMLSFSVAAVLPLINKYGIAMTNGLLAVMAWIGAGFLVLTIRYGNQMRSLVDVGYSENED